MKTVPRTDIFLIIAIGLLAVSDTSSSPEYAQTQFVGVHRIFDIQDSVTTHVTDSCDTPPASTSTTSYYFQFQNTAISASQANDLVTGA